MSQDFFGTNAPVDRLGNFEWKNVNPGNYIVQVYGGDGQGFFLKSVTLGGRDVATGFTASGPATLDLVVSTKGGMIEGTVVEKEKDVDDRCIPWPTPPSSPCPKKNIASFPIASAPDRPISVDALRFAALLRAATRSMPGRI